MADIDIAQAEADALIIMEKHRVDDTEWLFCPPGERLAIPLIDAFRNYQIQPVPWGHRGEVATELAA